MFEKELEEYLSTLKGRGGGEAGSELKKKVISAVTAMSRILDAEGLTRPDEKSYQTYRDNSTVDNSNTRANIGRIERFFSWLDKKQERTDEMTVENTENTAVTEATQDTEVEPIRAGRKKLLDENGEGRTEKNTVYLSRSKDRLFKSLCAIKGLSFAEYVSQLIDSELDNNKEALNFFSQAVKSAK